MWPLVGILQAIASGMAAYRSVLILWSGEWQRVERVAAALRHEHPESFRPDCLTEVGGSLSRVLQAGGRV
jgi:hypothetical protein